MCLLPDNLPVDSLGSGFMRTAQQSRPRTTRLISLVRTRIEKNFASRKRRLRRRMPRRSRLRRRAERCSTPPLPPDRLRTAAGRRYRAMCLVSRHGVAHGVGICPGGVQGRQHFRELSLDKLERAYRLPELVARAAMRARPDRRRPAARRAARRRRQAVASANPPQQDLLALALRAEPVRLRHLAVLEPDISYRAPADTEGVSRFPGAITPQSSFPG
jgi:hypothetical protein